MKVLLFLTAILATMAFSHSMTPFDLIETDSEGAIKMVSELKKNLNKKVITFIGYSGKGYQDNSRMLKTAQKKLATFSPDQYIVNIGVTYSGIGQIYTIAKGLGFQTIGIVSTKAEKYLDGVKDVNMAFMISDTNIYDYDYRKWGGYQSTQEKELTPVSEAMVSVSEVIIGFGGGDVAYAELKEAKARGIHIDFQCMMINKKKALEKALKKAKSKAEKNGGDYLDYYKNPKFYGRSCQLGL